MIYVADETAKPPLYTKVVVVLFTERAFAQNLLEAELISNVTEKDLFATGVRFVSAKVNSRFGR